MVDGKSLNSAGARRRIAHLMWMSNVFLGVLITVPLLKYAPFGGAVSVWVFGGLGLISSVLTLSLFPGLFSLLLTTLVRSRALGAWSVSATWSLFQLVLFADVQIYGHFRCHLNGMVWNVLTTEGADDAVSLANSDYAWVIGGLLVMLVLQYLGCSRLMRAETQRVEEQREVRPLTRARRMWWAFLIPIFIGEKLFFAFSDLVRDRRVTVLARVLPYYQPLTLKRFAERYFGYDLTERPSVKLDSDNLLLEYPKVQPQFPSEREMPNILMVVIDCWRQDSLHEDRTPGLLRFSQDARVFQDHIAGGNATRFGVFTLLYGLHGSYWSPVYLENRPPVLVSSLIDLGYQMSVYSSASMSYPEFRSTAWVEMEEFVHDDWGHEEGWKCDTDAVDGLVEMLETRQATGTEDPFFSYLMFDGSHQPYSFPEEEALYEPYTLAIDYVELSDAKKNTEKRTVRWNSYSNALLRVDKELQRVWDMLEMTGEMKDTIILVTGDHGEEFFDHGFYGHLSNFAPAQSLVPLIIRGPGVEPGFEERPTSHVDVATTLLELLGADGAQREGWSLGRSLFDPAETRTRVMSGWETLGLWTESGVFYLPINAALGGPELYDYEWNLVLDDEPMFKREAAHIARLMRECRRFLK